MLDHRALRALRAPRTLLPLLALVAPLGAGALAGCAQSAAADSEPRRVLAEPSPAAEPAIFGLEVAPAHRGEGAQRVVAPGRVVFKDGAVTNAAAPVAGRVTELRVAIGEQVKAGQLLAIVQSPQAATARAELARARVAVRGAEDMARRQAALAQKGVGLDIERAAAHNRLLDARAELAGAKAAVAAIESQDATGDPSTGAVVKIYAPADGQVIARRVELGAIVEPGASLFEIGDPTRLWVQVDVYEQDIASVRVGDRASVRLGGVSTPVGATVARVGALVDVEMRRAPVHLVLDPDAPAIRPGTFARADVFVADRDYVMVPATAVVVHGGQGAVVYVVDAPGKFSAREVQTGEVNEGRVAILSGLAEGEPVVIRGALLIDQAAEQLL